MMQEATDIYRKDSFDTSGNGQSKKSLNYPSKRFDGFFRKFDIYTKVDDDYRVKTAYGGLLSIIGWVIISILILGEINAYSYPKISEHMVVDTSLRQHLRININISFHALSCADVHLDAMDVAGDNQLNVEHDMLKVRLSQKGEVLETPNLALVHRDFKPKNECLSCYGAETESKPCCNTCDELKNAYESRGWNILFILKNSTQCMQDPTNPHALYQPGEGCRVSGFMKVNKVAGNFHISNGESIVRDGRHIHQFIPSEAPKYNVSHTIHSISFGEPYPRMKPNPLDGVTRIVSNERNNGPTGLFQYYIKIIPTIYTGDWGNKIYTNQYTYTERYRQFVLPSEDGLIQGSPVLPGIFFVYDLSPLMVEAKRNRVPLSHLFTKLCAIVGGIFTVLGVIDSILYKTGNFFNKKGK